MYVVSPEIARDGWPLSEAEYERVLTLDARERSRYFMQEVARRRILWILDSPDGLVAMGGEGREEALLVWPHPRFALTAAAGPHRDLQPAAVEWNEWIGAWAPGLAEHGKRWVEIFPLPDDPGFRLRLDRFELEVASYA